MSKKVILIITIVVLLVVAGALYLISGNKLGNQLGVGNGNSFEIQGMKVEILQQGSEAGAKNGDYLTTHYVASVQNGKEFDSSIKRNIPFTFQLGQSKVIKAWDLGLVGMKVGEVRRLTVPPELGYGLDGFPPVIPKKATLIYTIDLLKITPSSK